MISHCTIVISLGLALVAATGTRGCDNRDVDAAENVKISRVVAEWQPDRAVYRDKLTRGITGKIRFLSKEDGEAAIQADGDVCVYVFDFDDQGTDEGPGTPILVCKYDSGAWRGYATSDKSGTTYSVFVPCTGKDVRAARCRVRVDLIPQGGTRIKSEMATVELPELGDDPR